MLSWIAAATSRIGIATRVLGVPCPSAPAESEQVERLATEVIPALRD